MDGVDDPAAVLTILSPERGGTGGEESDTFALTCAPVGVAPSAARKTGQFLFSNLNMPGVFVRPEHVTGKKEECVMACCAPQFAQWAGPS